MDWLFAPFQLFIERPLLALIPTVAMAALWSWRRSKAALTAAILWALYTLYEFLLSRGIGCSGECNIRVDLLLLAPALLVAALVGVVQTLRKKAV